MKKINKPTEGSDIFMQEQNEERIGREKLKEIMKEILDRSPAMHYEFEGKLQSMNISYKEADYRDIREGDEEISSATYEEVRKEFEQRKGCGENDNSRVHYLNENYFSDDETTPVDDIEQIENQEVRGRLRDYAKRKADNEDAFFGSIDIQSCKVEA